MVAVDPRPVGRPDSRGVDQILDEEPLAGQRPGLRLPGLDGGDQRAIGIHAHDGVSATASTSIRNSGNTSAVTSTSVLAGRASPKNSCRTGLIRARSPMSVRNVVTLTTSAKDAPAAPRASPMFKNT